MARKPFQSKLPKDQELEKLFATAKALKKYDVLKSATTKASKIIEDRFRELTPQQTQAQRKKRANSQAGKYDWDKPLKNAIGSAVREYASNSVAFVGPRWPVGNKIYFVAEWKKKTRKVWYWGRNTGKRKRKVRNIAVQAFEETKPRTMSVMKKEIKASLDRMLK